MKKFLALFVALIALVGCVRYYDYYKGGVRYTQDGNDCVYYADEYGRNFSDDIRGMNIDKKIVYRNTRCADLYARDNAGNMTRDDRMALKPVITKKSCGSCGCTKQMRKYVVVTAM